MSRGETDLCTIAEALSCRSEYLSGVGSAALARASTGFA